MPESLLSAVGMCCFAVCLVCQALSAFRMKELYRRHISSVAVQISSLVCGQREDLPASVVQATWIWKVASGVLRRSRLMKNIKFADIYKLR